MYVHKYTYIHTDLLMFVHNIHTYISTYVFGPSRKRKKERRKRERNSILLILSIHFGEEKNKEKDALLIPSFHSRDPHNTFKGESESVMYLCVRVRVRVRMRVRHILLWSPSSSEVSYMTELYETKLITFSHITCLNI